LFMSELEHTCVCWVPENTASVAAATTVAHRSAVPLMLSPTPNSTRFTFLASEIDCTSTSASIATKATNLCIRLTCRALDSVKAGPQTRRNVSQES
jgi:hypothetical protein